MGAVVASAKPRDLNGMAPQTSRGEPVNFTINRLIKDTDISAVEKRTRAALAAHGFGVLSEIDVKATMKAKLGIDMPGYRILGACNPGLAWQAIGHEPRAGVMLPCNVILRETDTAVEVSAVDPVASMLAIDNPALQAIACEVRSRLVKVVDTI